MQIDFRHVDSTLTPGAFLGRRMFDRHLVEIANFVHITDANIEDLDSSLFDHFRCRLAGLGTLCALQILLLLYVWKASMFASRQ